MTHFFNQVQIVLINITMLFVVFSLFLIALQKNPVYAVFTFILTALSVFFLLLLVGAEFLALLILIIYTGVITVLFLFVVIIYNLRNVQISLYKFVFNPVLLAIFYKLYWINSHFLRFIQPLIRQTISISSDNLYTLDVVYFIALFNEHSLLFLGCGLLLLIAIIGSIVITYPFTKYQK